MNIKFFFIAKAALQNRIKLKKFIRQLFEHEGCKLGSLVYIFCSDEYLIQLNNDFLSHNYFTDILTFDLSTNEKVIDGEIYISVDRVKENAKNFKNSFEQELHRVIFHGALHLCGFKDKSKTDTVEMRKKEDEYLGDYFS